MRITNNLLSMNAKNNHQKSMKEIHDINKQLNGLKIQNSFEDSGIYNSGMRLNYEISTINQVVEASSKAKNMTLNTDKSLNAFTKQLETFKTKLVQGANDIHSSTSLNALADDLQGIKDHLVSIANTSINGKYLFSGTAIATKPITADGNYHGNNETIAALVGSKVVLPYNIHGKDLFTGLDIDYNKHLTSNVKLTNNIPKFDKIGNLEDTTVSYLNNSHKIMNLIGVNYRSEDDIALHGPLKIEKDFLFPQNFPNTVVYMQGKKPNGETFASKFQITADASTQDLLDKIGQHLGNDIDGKSKIVDVYLNDNGQINIKDLRKGNQVLDVHIIAATDQKASAQTAGNADQENLTDLKNKQNIYFTDIIVSNYNEANGDKSTAFTYDKARFVKNGSNVTGTIPQIVRDSNSFAQNTTKLSEVAGSKPYLDALNNPIKNGIYNIEGNKLLIDVVSKAKKADGTYKQYHVIIDLDPFDAKFTVTGEGLNSTNSIYQSTYSQSTTSQTISNFDNWSVNPGTIGSNTTIITQHQKTPAKDVTYKQLCDIIAMIASDNIPSNNATYEEYKDSIKNTAPSVMVDIDYKGRVNIKDLQNSSTSIEISIYDENSGKFNNFDSNGIALSNKGSFLSFSANNLISIDEPNVDIFKDLDSMIEAVRGGYYRADSQKNNSRNIGIQGALERIDHLIDHIEKRNTKIGSFGNAIESAHDRAEILRLNMETIKSEIMDTDHAEAMIKMMQRSMSYQAMLSTISKINSLSLVNYM